MTKIAIIGKPNVGKSSLFNRIARERDAITSDMAGTTRDVKNRLVQVNEKEAELIDTGGIDDSTELFSKVKDKSIQIAKEADIILYMVDGKALPQEDDKKLFYELQELDRHLLLLINKIDNDKMKENAWEFASFGAEYTMEISVSHNRGVGKLLSWMEARIPDEIEIVESEEEDFEDYLGQFDESGEIMEEEEAENNEIKVAIIGRVNVGKSSMLNALLGEERSIVSDVAGTTIDPVDEKIMYEDKMITFVDTAGIRRRGKIDGIERYALNRTEKMLEQADIALLILDSSEPFVELDEKIGGLVDRFKMGCIVVMNKWDIVHSDFKKMEAEVRHRFKYLEYAPLMTVSAMNNRNIEKLKQKILQVHKNFSQRISTSVLNNMLDEATKRHRLPSDKGRIVKVYYATQFNTKPPQFALIMNRPESLHFSYKRYLANFLREHVDFEGTPLIIVPRKKGERFDTGTEEED